MRLYQLLEAIDHEVPAHAREQVDVGFDIHSGEEVGVEYNLACMELLLLFPIDELMDTDDVSLEIEDRVEKLLAEREEELRDELEDEIKFRMLEALGNV